MYYLDITLCCPLTPGPAVRSMYAQRGLEGSLFFLDSKQTFGSGALSQDPNILCPEASHTMSHQLYGIYADDIIIIISTSSSKTSNASRAAAVAYNISAVTSL